jgi:peptidoglycan/xylan/chitin deacetylase (PgdA/CDA1 family)
LILLSGIVASTLFLEDRSLLITTLLILSLLYAIALTVGVTTIKWNYFMNSINRVGEGKICFTFDDGPVENTRDVLAVLNKHEVKATFFLIGKNCKENQNILKEIVAEGHIIGNHSFSHENSIGWSSTSKVIEEIEQTNQIIKEVSGIQPQFYRPPFGITNPKIARAIAKTKMISVGWTIRTFDTVVKDAEKLIAKVKPRLNKKGHIILMHDSCPQTVVALDQLIINCKEKGIKIVNLDDIAQTN